MLDPTRIEPPPELYLSDPQRTELGRKILASGLTLMNELGLENFTFRKLAKRIDSTEASVYRYFGNKHQLLLYFASWYWSWIRHLIDRAAASHRDPRVKLRMTVSTLVKPVANEVPAISVSGAELHRLMSSEGTKAYRSELVGAHNDRGRFRSYEALTTRIADLILQLAPGCKNPRALSAALCELAHDQLYFARHLPRLTELEDGANLDTNLERLLWQWTLRLLDLPPDEIYRGKRTQSPSIFITRTIRADSPLLKWAARSGCDITGYSLLRFDPVPFTAPDRAEWWFFYSSQAVRHCLSQVTPPPGARLAALGTGTAKTLKELAGRVDFTGRGTPGQVAEQFLSVAGGQRVFFPRAENSHRTIQLMLDGKIGAEEAICYRNELAPPREAIPAEVYIFTSPLNVRAYLTAFKLPEGAQLLAIGGVTAAELYQRGYQAAFPPCPSEEALVRLLGELYPEHSASLNSPV